MNIQVSADTSLNVVCNNSCENYILVRNAGSGEADIIVNSVSVGGVSVSQVIMPVDGITVTAGKYVEISVYANSEVAVITASTNLN